jgi:hypothetical protein
LYAAFAQGAGVARLALRGFGDAVKAEDMEQFREATKGWTEEAVRAARLVRGPLTSAFEGLQRVAQRGFFGGDLLGAGQRALEKALPTLRRVVGETAGALGELATQGLRLFASRAWQRDLATVGARNVRVITTLGGGALHLADALRNVLVAAGPLIRWMADAAARGARLVDAWTAQARASGALAGFFEKTRDSAGLLGGILRSLGRVFLEVGKAANPLGREILVALNAEFGELADRVQTAQTRASLRAYFARARPLVFEVGRLIRDAAAALGRLSAIDPRQTGLLRLVRDLRTRVLPIFEAVGESAAKNFGPVLTDALISIARLFGNLAGENGPLIVFVRTIGNMAGNLADLLEEHPGLRSFVFTMAGLVGIMKALSFAGAVSGLSRLFALVTPTSVGTTAAMGTALSGTAAGANATALAAPRAAFGIRAIGAAIRANPIGVIITALQLAAAGLILLWQRSATFRRIVTGVFAAIRSAAGAVVSFFTGPFVGFLRRAFEIAKTIIWDVWLRPYREAFKLARTAAEALVGFFRGPFVGFFSGAWSKVKDLFWGAIRWIADKFLGFAETMLRLADKGFGWIPGLGGKIDDAREKIARMRAELNRTAAKTYSIRFVTNAGRVKSQIEDLRGSLPGRTGDVSYIDVAGLAGRRDVSSALNPALLLARQMGLGVTSTYRPGATVRGSGARSDHSYYPSKAVDFVGPPALMRRFALAVAGLRGVDTVISSLLGRSRGLWKAGFGWGPILSQATWADHFSHVHVDTFDDAMRRRRWLMPGITIAGNFTGRPEPVGASAGGATINVNVGPVWGSMTARDADRVAVMLEGALRGRLGLGRSGPAFGA